MNKITPCLWFDNNAEQAVEFYTAVFKNCRVIETTRYGDAGPGPKGSVLTITFELQGQRLIALNGGPHYKFTPAVSMLVQCETQGEVDEYWSQLTKDGQPMQCGWVTDKFGFSWQIVPAALFRMLQDKDPRRSQRVMRAMLQMVKLDLDSLRRAYDGN